MGPGASGQGPEGLAGQTIAGYRLDTLLGEGATGAVFLATRLPETPAIMEQTGMLPTALPDQAAIKLLIPSGKLDAKERDTFHARFVREAQTLQRLRHPHIVPVLSYGQDPASGLMYMILPHLSGGTLATWLAHVRGRGLPFANVTAYLSQLAAALDYAHSQGLIHRDIKPANVLLDAAYQAYLADFSIVRLVEESHTQLTTTGRIMGTPAYMAPEQISGVGPLGPASDLYSLGMVVYEMVTGRVAFDSGSLMELIHQHTTVAPPPPTHLRPDLPPPAEAAILRALAKQPQDRFATAAEFAQAFAEGLSGRWAAGLTAYLQSGQRPPAAANAATLPDSPAPTPTPAPQPMSTGPAPAAYPVAAYPGAAYPGSAYPGMAYPVSAYPGMAYPGTTTAPAAPVKRTRVALVALVIAALLLVGAATGLGAVFLSSRNALSQANRTPTATTQTSPALVATGALLFKTSAPGMCDSAGGSWAHTASANQSCDSGGLVLAGNSVHQIGVVTLASIPGNEYPQNYVLQIQTQSLGSDNTANFGVKFDQQSVQDTGQGRGGYAFMVNQNGQWQFNRYASDGTRHIITQGVLTSGMNVQNTLDVFVNGSTYSFFINSQFVTQKVDATYQSGYICLVAEAGARVLFSDFSLYAPPA